MTGPGIFSYSTTPASNVTANTGINWDEGMAPAAVNNSARQNMTDLRNAFNDLIWFRYGKGDLDYSPVYVAATQFKIAGADVTTAYHVGRRVKVVGSGTGTIYGTISVSSFSTDTTITCVFNSGSLSNEALTVYLSQVPLTGVPVPSGAISGTKTNDSAAAGTVGEFLTSSVAQGSAFSLTTGTATNIASVDITPGDWDVWGNILITKDATTTITDFRGWIHTVSGTQPTLPNGGAFFVDRNGAGGNLSSGDIMGSSVGTIRMSVSATTTIYLTTTLVFGTSTAAAYGVICARRRR
jgi:hypothetical protein